MNAILLTLILAANPQSLPYEPVAISLPYTGEITLPQKSAVNPATKKPLHPIDQEFIEQYHWRLSPGSCGMLGCTVHGGGWVKQKTRVAVAKKSQDRGTAGKEQTAHRTEAPRVRAPVYHLPQQRCPPRVFGLLRGG